jgi:hypothetical protein
MKKLKHNSKRNSVMLCCNSKACPEVYPKGENSIQIRDDDGFIITITKDQARMISDAVDIIEKENKASDI